MGQKDLVHGAAHLWLDNAAHTWRAVVDGLAVPPVSGTIGLAMGAPGAPYQVSWYDTVSGQVTATQTVVADDAGVVTLAVSNLGTDLAVRLQR